jgi:hypothetical protein
MGRVLPATAVDAENYLFECMRYIERNPVPAGMAARPRDCVCPGYQANVVGKADASVNRHSVYRSTGNGGQAAHVANEWRIILWPVFGNPQCSAPVQIQP